MQKTKKTFFIIITNALLAFVLLLFHYSGASIAVSSANPMAVLALLVAIIMYSSEIAGVLTGMFLGVVLDSVTATPIGFNTLTLTVISFAAALISHYLFNRNLKAALALCLLFTFAYFFARWIVGFAFTGDTADSFVYLIRYAVP
ncbi:MAG: rod shape-determining protein MreD, partial [Clostridia bacterium]|nr:rod shape-determining protein MreD [Clostridia bacterium]